MVTLYIEGIPYTVKTGQNLLQACLGLGFDVPYFCWHPALGSVGSCRQCAVKRFKDENDTRGTIVMACMTPAEDGVRISISDPEAVQFRASVLEWLMLNHPHDCPVCDEGGECHLQDMTVMTGHNYRASRFPKRTHRNQDLGPFLNHEMNRCIQCYRCVRFYHDYAGGNDLNVLASHHHVYFGRSGTGPLESEFSGNLVEICPTGVFTDRSFKRHSTRKWDLQSAPSLCVHCALGCNTLPGERYGELRRIRNRYHPQVNGYFLCDRGRYGYEFVNSRLRIREPLGRRDGKTDARPLTEALIRELAATLLSERDRIIGIGSPRASLEANFALRCLVGADRFHAGVSAADFSCLSAGTGILREGPAPAASLQEVGLADAALVLGEDVTQTAPLLALNLRRMRYRRAAGIAAGFQLPEWNDAGVRELAQLQVPTLFMATPVPTRLDDEAAQRFHGAPAALTDLAFAVLRIIAPDAAPAGGGPGEGASLYAMARKTADALLTAAHPLIVTGTGCGAPALIEAAANVAWALRRKGRPASLAICVPECNSLGLGLMSPHDLTAASQAIREGRADTLVILENDLYQRADAAVVDDLLERARNVIVIDHLETATSAKADLVLPAATFAEAAGTLVNSEGRAQRGYAVMPPEGPVRAAWRWLQLLMEAAGCAEGRSWHQLTDVTAALAEMFPLFEPATGLSAPIRVPTADGRLPRQSHRYSGRTAMSAHRHVSEPKPPSDADGPLAFSMEGYDGVPPAPLISRYWSPGWNSVQALNKFQMEIGGPLRGEDPGRRLIEPAPSDDGRYFDPPAPAAPLKAGEVLVTPIHHIFGSEPLSRVSAAIAQRAPTAYLAMAPEGAPAGNGEKVRLEVNGQAVSLPLRLVPGMPPDVAGLPVGLPGLPVTALPAVGSISAKKRGGGSS